MKTKLFSPIKIRNKADIYTSAVGMIVNPYQAEHILCTQQADIIVLGRALLSDPYWVFHAGKVLGEKIEWPFQYLRASNI